MESINKNNIKMGGTPSSPPGFSWNEMQTGINKKIVSKKRLLLLQSFKYLTVIGLSVLAIFMGAFFNRNYQLGISEENLAKENISHQMAHTELNKHLGLNKNSIALDITPPINQRSSVHTGMNNIDSKTTLQKEITEDNKEGFLFKTTSVLTKSSSQLFSGKHLSEVARINSLKPGIIRSITLDSIPIDSIIALDTSKVKIVLFRADTFPPKSKLSISAGINTMQNHPFIHLKGFSIDLDYSFPINARNYIGIGLKFDNLRYMFQHNSSWSTTRFEVTGAYIDTLNNEGFEAYSLVTSQGSRKVVSYNSHQLLSVPVYYGYQLFKEYTITLEAGFQINAYKKSRGKINLPESPNSVVVISSKNIFKKFTGVHSLIGLKMSHSISDRLSLFGRASLAHSLGSWYGNKNYSTKPTVFKFNLGIEF